MLDALQRDLPNIRKALDYAVTAGEASGCLRLTVALRRFWAMRGHAGEARKWIGHGLRLSTGQATQLRVNALHLAGLLAEIQGDLSESRRYFSESAALARGIGDRAGLAQGVASLGEVWLGSGEYAEARARLEEGKALRRELGDEIGEKRLVMSLSDAALGLGDYDAAADYAEQGLAATRQEGNRHNESQALFLP